jgi:FeS assembly SUF system protein
VSEEIEARVVEALRTCFDPEIPVNIYDLGLVYEVTVSDEGHAYVKMTFTSPACPVADDVIADVEHKVRVAEGVETVEVDIVWDPPWDQTMLSEAARLQLGL